MIIHHNQLLVIIGVATGGVVRRDAEPEADPHRFFVFCQYRLMTYLKDCRHIILSKKCPQDFVLYPFQETRAPSSPSQLELLQAQLQQQLSWIQQLQQPSQHSNQGPPPLEGERQRQRLTLILIQAAALAGAVGGFKLATLLG